MSTSLRWFLYELPYIEPTHTDTVPQLLVVHELAAAFVNGSEEEEEDECSEAELGVPQRKPSLCWVGYGRRRLCVRPVTAELRSVTLSRRA